jgi:hypothetical protein
MLFNGSQVALIIMGSLPLPMWKSFQPKASPAVAPR